MALVLTRRVDEDFFIDDVRVVLQELRGRSAFVLYVPEQQKSYHVTSAEAVEIVPDVFVSSGGCPQANVARMAIQAPPEMQILRGERYRGEEKVEHEQEAKVSFKRGSQLWPRHSR